jgi:hypothetical protein
MTMVMATLVVAMIVVMVVVIVVIMHCGIVPRIYYCRLTRSKM